MWRSSRAAKNNSKPQQEKWIPGPEASGATPSARIFKRPRVRVTRKKQKIDMTSCSSAGALPALRPAPRRRCRVLYPPSRCRRWTPKEDPDRALRWVRLLGALLFVQIFNEDSGPGEKGTRLPSHEVPVSRGRVAETRDGVLVQSRGCHPEVLKVSRLNG